MCSCFYFNSSTLLSHCLPPFFFYPPILVSYVFLYHYVVSLSSFSSSSTLSFNFQLFFFFDSVIPLCTFFHKRHCLTVPISLITCNWTWTNLHRDMTWPWPHAAGKSECCRVWGRLQLSLPRQLWCEAAGDPPAGYRIGDDAAAPALIFVSRWLVPVQ